MAQIASRNSLRDIIENMSAQAHRLYHLGSAKLSRSNLFHINEDKPYTMYEALYEILLHRYQEIALGHHIRFKNLLYSLNTSTIDLWLSVFPWTDFRTTKGMIKLHAGLNHDDYLPEFVTVAEGKEHDVTIARTLKPPQGSLVTIDNGYNNYAWYKRLTDKGIFFVTRLKNNAAFRVINRQPVLKDKGLTSDKTIEFTGIQPARKYPIQLRRIEYQDAQTGKHYTFPSNNFKLSASTTADIYKAKWQVRLFFKWIKQNLKIK